MKKITVVYISDPGHAWMKVKKNYLKLFDIENEISSFSLLRGRSVFLEQDVDAQLFLTKAEEHGYTIAVKEHPASNKPSRIRKYESYHVITKKEEEEKKMLIDQLLECNKWDDPTIRKIKRGSLEDLRHWAEIYK